MRDILKEGSRMLGGELSENQIDMLCRYSELLVEWNGRMNLTAITDEREIAIKHFLDSLSVLATGKVGENVIDVGTGAGFPGLVIKIARPEIRLTLLDSLKKRLTFLEAVASELSLDNVQLIHARAEEGARRPQLREKFDTAVSRAVANMTKLSEYCLPYVKPGGYFLALKGPQAEEEIKEARRTISILGGGEPEIIDAYIPFGELSHKTAVVKKVRRTPMQFPRKSQQIAKSAVESCYQIYKKPGK